MSRAVALKLSGEEEDEGKVRASDRSDPVAQRDGEDTLVGDVDLIESCRRSRRRAQSSPPADGSSG